MTKQDLARELLLSSQYQEQMADAEELITREDEILKPLSSLGEAPYTLAAIKWYMGCAK